MIPHAWLLYLRPIKLNLLHYCTITLFQVRITLDEKNDIADIKNYLTTDLEAAGPEPLPKGRKGISSRRYRRAAPRQDARPAFKEMYNDIVAIKNYLRRDSEANGPETLGRGRRGNFFRRPQKPAQRQDVRPAFKEMYLRLKEDSYGDRPDIPNVCLLLVNEERTSRYLEKSGVNRFCDHTFVFSGEEKIDLAAIRKKICPEAQFIRGMCD